MRSVCEAVLILLGIVALSQSLVDLGTVNSSPVEFVITPSYFLSNADLRVAGGWQVFYAPDDFYFPDSIPPFTNLVFHLKSGNVTLHMDFRFRKSYMAVRKYLDSGFFYIPDPPHVSLGMDFPFTSYLLFDLGDQKLMIGRSKLKWGFWEHPVALSGAYPYLDHITYVLNGEWWSYSFSVVSINPMLTKEEYEIQKNTRPVNADPTSPYFDRTKNLVAHRVEFRLLDFLTLGIGELTMVGGKTLDLQTVDPLAVLHNNFNEAYTNSMLDLQFVLSKWDWTYFLEFALDDFAVALTEPKDLKPTAYGFTTGVIKHFEWGKISLDYTTTTRWMYNTFLPYLKFNARYIFLSNFPVGARSLVDYPLGFEYGPDATLVSLTVRLDEPISARLEIGHLWKGPVTIETEYKNPPQGDISRYWLIELDLQSRHGLGTIVRVIGDRWLIGLYWSIGFKVSP